MKFGFIFKKNYKINNIIYLSNIKLNIKQISTFIYYLFNLFQFYNKY